MTEADAGRTAGSAADAAADRGPAGHPPAAAPAASSQKTIAPYGSWRSDVSAEALTRASPRLGQTALDGERVLWTEGRSWEAGRNILVCAEPDAAPRDLTPVPWNVRTLAHEYGGGAFAVGAGGTLFFSHFDDQRVYRRDRSGAIAPLTSASGMRYADAALDRARNRLVAIREDTTGGGEPVSTVVAIELAGGAESVLAEGHDFHSNPRPSPDGRQLAWLTWDHPDMPWDGSALWVAPFQADGRLGTPRLVASGRSESVFQPEWSPDGTLHFVADRTGWWNLYRDRGGAVEALCPMSAEFGEPQWSFGMTTYGFDARGRIVCTYQDRGRSRVGVVEAGGGVLQEIETPYQTVRELKVGPGFAVFLGGSPTAPEAVVRLDLASGRTSALRVASDRVPDPEQASCAEPITFPSADGRVAHAYFYAPRNRHHAAPEGERPPLLAISHGGPTGATNPTFRWSLQYWTERGFAVVDVNYGGSTGFGRAYRELLNGRWGIVDVEDTIHAVRFLVDRGDVDPKRLAIRGASAGGYTTLAALTFHDVFVAGASHYGIGDLEALARDTHKFESRYLERLIGPNPAQQALYRERSPVHHTDRLSSALILFQGAEDRAVPKEQAEAMHAAVKAKGLPVAFLLFAHEQHGFRRAENIRRALEAELFFYGKVLGFEPADAIEPVPIDNLPAAASGGAARPPTTEIRRS